MITSVKGYLLCEVKYLTFYNVILHLCYGIALWTHIYHPKVAIENGYKYFKQINRKILIFIESNRYFILSHGKYRKHDSILVIQTLSGKKKSNACQNLKNPNKAYNSRVKLQCRNFRNLGKAAHVNILFISTNIIHLHSYISPLLCFSSQHTHKDLTGKHSRI